MVHHWMLPLPQQHLNDRECRRRAQGAAPGRLTAGGRRPKHDTDGEGERPEGNVHRGGTDGIRNRGYGNALPPAPMHTGTGKEDVDHGQRGEGSPVLDGLHPRERSSSLLEHVRLGPKVQHRSLYGAGMPSQHPR